jgi:hypothetical protein
MLKNKKDMLWKNLRNISEINKKKEYSRVRKSVSLESNKNNLPSKRLIIPKSTNKFKKSFNNNTVPEKLYKNSFNSNLKNKFNTMKTSIKRNSRLKKNVKHSSSVEIDITSKLMNSKFFKTSNGIHSKKSIDSKQMMNSFPSIEKQFFHFQNLNKVTSLGEGGTIDRIQTNRSISNHSATKSKSYDKQRIKMRVKSKNKKSKVILAKTNIFSSFNRKSNRIIQNKYSKRPNELKKPKINNTTKYTMKRKSKLKKKGEGCNFFTKKYS